MTLRKLPSATLINQTGRDLAISVCYYNDHLTIWIANKTMDTNHPFTAKLVKGEMVGSTNIPLPTWEEHVEIVRG